MVAIGIFFNSLLCGCGNSVKPSEIPGVYKSVYSQGMEVLALKENGSFLQDIRLKSATNVVRTTGTWRFDSRDQSIIFDQRYLITLTATKELDPNFQRPQTGVAIRPIGHWFGKLEIGTSESIIYVKQKDGTFDPADLQMQKTSSDNQRKN